MTENDIKNALQELYEREGTQKALAQLAGITQSTINAYLSGKAKIRNMPLGVFLKLFRDVKIDFFGKTIEQDPVEQQIFDIVAKLSASDKAKCLKMLAANFSDQIIEEFNTQRERKNDKN